MSQLQTFNHPKFGELEVLIKDNQKYFPGNEVAAKLQYARPHKAVADHCKDDGVLTWDTADSMGRLQKKKFISLGNVSRLITSAVRQSRNMNIREHAADFESWIYDDIVPSVIEHGAYMTPEKIEETLMNPDTIIQLATNLKDEQQKRQAAEQQLQLDKPYSTFGKAVSNSNASINVGAFAKMIYENHGLRIGRNKLFAWLREQGYLIKHGRERNNPKQKYIEQGLFDTSVTLISRTEGDVESVTTLVTGKGQVNLMEKLLSEYTEVT